MIRAFHDPSTPVGVCACGEVIDPREQTCPECLASGVAPINLDPVAVAVTVLCLIGVMILSPLVFSLFQIWRNE